MFTLSLQGRGLYNLDASPLRGEAERSSDEGGLL